jgi:hypothetical protein
MVGTRVTFNNTICSGATLAVMDSDTSTEGIEGDGIMAEGSDGFDEGHVFDCSCAAVAPNTIDEICSCVFIERGGASLFVNSNTPCEKGGRASATVATTPLRYPSSIPASVTVESVIRSWELLSSCELLSRRMSDI